MLTRLAVVTILFAAQMASAGAIPSRILWGVDGAQNNLSAKLFRINPATGSALQVGTVGRGITGLAVDPTTGTLFAASNTDYNGVLAAGRGLVTIDRATGSPTPVGAFNPAMPENGVSGGITDITFASTGQLFGWWDGGGAPKDLVTIDKTTAAHTIVGDSGIPTTKGPGLGFCGSTLYLAPDAPESGLIIPAKLHTLNAATGLSTGTINLMNTAFAGEAMRGLACTLDGVLFAVQLGVNGGSVPGQAHLLTLPTPATGAVTDVGATTNKMNALAIDEVIVDAVDATPPSAASGVPITFTATVRATSPATITWHFADGSPTQTGASVMHTFAANGVYVVTATADAAGPVQDVGTVDVNIGTVTTSTTSTSTSTSTTSTTTTSPTTTSSTSTAPPTTTSTTLDAVTTTSTSIAPATTTTTTIPPLPLTIDKMKVILNFAKSAKDSITFKGSLVPPTGFAPTGQVVDIDVGGVAAQGTLNKKGKSPTFKLKASGKFSGTLKRGVFAAALADEGLTDETVSGKAVDIAVSIELGDQRYATDRALSYGAKVGKKGTAK